MAENERLLSRDEILFHVEQALRKGRKLWPRKRVPGDVGRYRPLAEEIVAHLALCGVRKLCTGSPPAVRRVRALFCALSERRAGATTDVRRASAVSGSSSSNSIGRSFRRMCHSP